MEWNGWFLLRETMSAWYQYIIEVALARSNLCSAVHRGYTKIAKALDESSKCLFLCFTLIFISTLNGYVLAFN